MTDYWTLLTDRIKELESLAAIGGVVEWDQQCFMPKQGAAPRAQHSATIAAIMHEKGTAPEVGEWITALGDEVKAKPDRIKEAAWKLNLRHYNRSVKVPVDLVKRTAVARSNGFVAWNKAKADNNFSDFVKPLEELVAIMQETAACYGPAAHPYDNLLEDYDPGALTADLQPMFKHLGGELSDFVGELSQRPAPPTKKLILDVKGQKELSERIIRSLGFRMDAGRLDESAHPFTIGLHPNDVRLTTHYQEHDFLNALGGTIHECGHGMYEQGLPLELAGTGLMRAGGMGIHESQSRFWENIIGRSLPFCEWLVPHMKEIWPNLDLTSLELYQLSNTVQPSLIRIKADEVTYNLHIIVRFQLELALISGDLAVVDLQDAWNEAYEKIVRVRPTNPAEGVLQDVHWSSGLFGYFPSYTIGNLYSASFAATMEQDIPAMWDQVREGDFSNILEWMGNKVHKHGSISDPPVVFANAVGERDSVADLMAHFRNRHGALYGM